MNMKSKIISNGLLWKNSYRHVNDKNFFDMASNEFERLLAIEQAATALIKCKGRYHAELNTNMLAAALGIELPYIGSIYEPELPLQVKMADILAIQLNEAKRGDPYNHGLYNGMLYMVAAHDGGEYKPVGKEDFYSQTGTPNPLLELVILDVVRDGTAGIDLHPSPEPFGYFRNDGFDWHDCHDDDEGAIALYERP
jgi:hypothetical protein